MPVQRKRIALSVLIIAGGSFLAPHAASRASACPLTNWLNGGQQTVAVASLPVTNGTFVPYTASFAPVASGFTPLTVPQASNTIFSNRPLLATGGTSVFAPRSTFTVQRPAFGAVPLNNPSVYTGLPVLRGFRGASSGATGIAGTGNLYPGITTTTTPGITALRPALAPAATPTFATPIRTGLSRFFGSLLGTGVRSSFVQTPVTFYRPANTIDPLTGATVTVQQPCTSSVTQLQRTPLTTFSPVVGGATQIAPCGASGCDSGSNFATGISPIPSTMAPSTISPNGMMAPNGISPNGNPDFQPLAPPSLPSQNFSGRPDLTMPFTGMQPSQMAPSSSSSFDSGSFGPTTNMRPLTGARPDMQSELGDDRSTRSQYTPFSTDAVPSASDREPMEAPSLNLARPATQPDAKEAYRLGYEAARMEMLREQQEQERRKPEAPSTGSFFDLAPPENSPSSMEEMTREPVQRSRYEIERDQRDLRDLTTSNQHKTPEDYYRVRPIPASDNFRNPFEAAKQPVSQPEATPPSYQPRTSRDESSRDLRAPALLPPLPNPATQFRSSYERPTRYSNETRLSVPVREASMQSTEPTRQPTSANEWQSKVRKQTQESGWYAK